MGVFDFNITHVYGKVYKELHMEKVVLVHVGERARPVSFVGGVQELRLAVKECFKDILDDESWILQVECDCHK